MTTQSAYATPPVVPERQVASGDFSATLRWEAADGVRFTLTDQGALSGGDVSRYAMFLRDLAERQSAQFDVENQQNSMPLEEHGFVPVVDSSGAASPYWVSESVESPLPFGTPVLTWDTAFNFQAGRPCAQLILGALGLLDRENPLRDSAAWNDQAGLESLIARARATDTYVVEMALVNSDIVRTARSRWLQEQRIQQFIGQLQRSQHVKHSRIARILRERHGRGSARPLAFNGYLSVFDFPGTRIVPLIGLRRFDSEAVRATLAEEGLSPLPQVGRGDFWTNIVHRQWTFWVADPNLFDMSDTHLIGWLEREIQQRCYHSSADRRYPV
jgi:hypothetical protein